MRIIYLIILFFSSAFADLPLNLDEIYTDKGKIKFENNIAYANSEQRANSYSNPIYIQTGTNSFVAIPTYFSQTQTNNDTIIATTGLRYGLTSKTDIYANLSYLWQNIRSFDGINETSNKNDYLYNAIFGISQTILKDGQNPMVIGFIEASIFEKILGKSFYTKSWLVGISAYKAIDPIVLGFSGAYRFSSSYDSAYGKYKAGNYLLLNPTILFAANDKITLSSGILWINQQAQKLDDKKLSIHSTTTYMKFGVGFGYDDKTTFSLSAKFKTSSQSASEINLGIIHTF